ncbi:TfdA family taurine catabolism dioxygenase TauD [Xylariaceae sp. FL0804]|nr:TfdA family taurine catabolism dioxygenase TauD [Xylariaceae sp. FL0804]KAI0474945.1 TfdA family taurine catabolism dioxygenase TauD [Xylariaceae sp. FL0804]
MATTTTTTTTSATTGSETEPVTWVTPAARPPPGQPDISYAPDHAKWQARTARRLAAEGDKLPSRLPSGFPEQMAGPMVWEGATLAETYDWTYVLSADQLREIDEAVVHFKSLGLPFAHIQPSTFPLPTLRAELRRLSRELHSGHGFFVLRGVDVSAHSREDNIVIYLGLAAHIAPQRGRQDHKHGGKPADVVLTHIKDLSHGSDEEVKGTIGSPAYTTDKQVFHTDSGDIVSLFALETAASGGASKLASTWRVYNEIARTRPDLIHTLTQEWDYEVFEKAEKQWTPRPLMYLLPPDEARQVPSRIALQYGRRYFVGFGALPRSEAIPPITEAQAEALDALHFTGDRFCVNTEFRKGDMQFVNNLGLFHARDGFVNQGEKQRHLLRLWLRDPENAWHTPDYLAPRWAQIYEGITPEAEVFPLEPFVRSAGNKGR